MIKLTGVISAEITLVNYAIELSSVQQISYDMTLLLSSNRPIYTIELSRSLHWTIYTSAAYTRREMRAKMAHGLFFTNAPFLCRFS